MKCTHTTAVLTLAAVLLAPFAGHAGDGRTPEFDVRQARQQARLDAGVAAGALTLREAVRLQSGQRHLQAVEDQVKADGVITPRERARLEHAADVQSRHIWRQKHDRQYDFNHDGERDLVR
jgi:hypothetical protein